MFIKVNCYKYVSIKAPVKIIYKIGSLRKIYLVEGCSDPDLPAAMWMRRDSYEALVGCKVDAPMTWILKCVDGTWEGQVGICPAVPVSSSGSVLAASSSLQVPASAVQKSAKIPLGYQENNGMSLHLCFLKCIFIQALIVNCEYKYVIK